jgi:hypothetical protein
MGNEEEKSEAIVCPFCGKPVRFLLTAIASGSDNMPAHFDCVLRSIAEKEGLEENEKVCYLGKGSFGIIKYKAQGSAKFTIRKRVQYEIGDTIVEWRKSISDSMRNR